jgi:hypothetical protein
MEWVLQVADEVDDAVAALRHRWLGLNGEMGALLQALRKCASPRNQHSPRAVPFGRAFRS